MIETVLDSPEDEKVIAAVRAEVNEVMSQFPLFAY
jgi:glycine hydroxymethyltransferase